LAGQKTQDSSMAENVLTEYQRIALLELQMIQLQRKIQELEKLIHPIKQKI